MAGTLKIALSKPKKQSTWPWGGGSLAREK